MPMTQRTAATTSPTTRRWCQSGGGDTWGHPCHPLGDLRNHPPHRGDTPVTPLGCHALGDPSATPLGTQMPPPSGQSRQPCLGDTPVTLGTPLSPPPRGHSCPPPWGHPRHPFGDPDATSLGDTPVTSTLGTPLFSPSPRLGTPLSPPLGDTPVPLTILEGTGGIWWGGGGVSRTPPFPV